VNIDESERHTSNFNSNLICEKLLRSNFTSSIISGFTEDVTLSKSLIQVATQECISRKESTRTSASAMWHSTSHNHII